VSEAGDAEGAAEERTVRQFAKKMRQLAQLEYAKAEAAAAAADREESEKSATGDARGAADGVEAGSASLVATLANNVQITINSVHIRYEDEDIGDRGCAGGLTIEQLSGVTTDESFNDTFVGGGAQRLFKRVAITNIAMYVDPAPDVMYAESGDLSDLLAREMIAESDDTAGRLREVVRSLAESPKAVRPNLSADSLRVMHPVTGVCRVRYARGTAALHSDFDFGCVAVRFTRDQYATMVRVADRITLDARGERYLQWHPPRGVTAKAQPRAWWQFAINSVLSDVRERRKRSTWDFITSFVSNRGLYTRLWRERVAAGQLSPSDQEALDKLERDLSFNDIALFRAVAEMQLLRSPKLTELLRQDRERREAAASWTGWAASWISTGVAAEQSKETETPSSAELTPLSKDSDVSLAADDWSAIYTKLEHELGGELPAPPTLPDTATSVDEATAAADFNYDRTQFTFRLESAVMVVNFDQDAPLLVAQLDRFYTSFTVFQHHARRVALSVGSVVAVDCAASSPRHLVRMAPQAVAEGEAPAPMLRVGLDVRCREGFDYFVSASLLPLTIIYSPKFVLLAHRFMAVNSLSSVSAEDVHIGTLARVERLRRTTRDGVLFAIEHQRSVGCDIDVRAPTIVVPEYRVVQDDVLSSGSRTPPSTGASVRERYKVVFDLGRVRMARSKQDRQNVQADAPDDAQFYRRFRITIDHLSAWMAVLQPHEIPLPSTPDDGRMALINEVSLSIPLEVSRVADPTLPSLRARVELPPVQVSLSGPRLRALLSVLETLFGVRTNQPTPPDAGPADGQQSGVGDASETGGVSTSSVGDDHSSMGGGGGGSGGPGDDDAAFVSVASSRAQQQILLELSTAPAPPAPKGAKLQQLSRDDKEVLAKRTFAHISLVMPAVTVRVNADELMVSAIDAAMGGDKGSCCRRRYRSTESPLAVLTLRDCSFDIVRRTYDATVHGTVHSFDILDVSKPSLPSSRVALFRTTDGQSVGVSFTSHSDESPGHVGVNQLLQLRFPAVQVQLNPRAFIGILVFWEQCTRVSAEDSPPSSTSTPVSTPKKKSTGSPSSAFLSPPGVAPTTPLGKPRSRPGSRRNTGTDRRPRRRTRRGSAAASESSGSQRGADGDAASEAVEEEVDAVALRVEVTLARVELDLNRSQYMEKLDSLLVKGLTTRTDILADSGTATTTGNASYLAVGETAGRNAWLRAQEGVHFSFVAPPLSTLDAGVYTQTFNMEANRVMLIYSRSIWDDFVGYWYDFFAQRYTACSLDAGVTPFDAFFATTSVPGTGAGLRSRVRYNLKFGEPAVLVPTSSWSSAALLLRLRQASLHNGFTSVSSTVSQVKGGSIGLAVPVHWRDDTVRNAVALCRESNDKMRAESVDGRPVHLGSLGQARRAGGPPPDGTGAGGGGESHSSYYDADASIPTETMFLSCSRVTATPVAVRRSPTPSGSGVHLQVPEPEPEPARKTLKKKRGPAGALLSMTSRTSHRAPGPTGRADERVRAINSLDELDETGPPIVTDLEFMWTVEWPETNDAWHLRILPDASWHFSLGDAVMRVDDDALLLIYQILAGNFSEPVAHGLEREARRRQLEAKLRGPPPTGQSTEAAARIIRQTRLSLLQTSLLFVYEETPLFEVQLSSGELVMSLATSGAMLAMTSLRTFVLNDRVCDLAKSYTDRSVASMPVVAPEDGAVEPQVLLTFVYAVDGRQSMLVSGSPLRLNVAYERMQALSNYFYARNTAFLAAYGKWVVAMGAETPAANNSSVPAAAPEAPQYGSWEYSVYLATLNLTVLRSLDSANPDTVTVATGLHLFYDYQADAERFEVRVVNARLCRGSWCDPMGVRAWQEHQDPWAARVPGGAGATDIRDGAALSEGMLTDPFSAVVSQEVKVGQCTSIQGQMSGLYASACFEDLLFFWNWGMSFTDGETTSTSTTRPSSNPASRKTSSTTAPPSPTSSDEGRRHRRRRGSSIARRSRQGEVPAATIIDAACIHFPLSRQLRQFELEASVPVVPLPPVERTEVELLVDDVTLTLLSSTQLAEPIVRCGFLVANTSISSTAGSALRLFSTGTLFSDYFAKQAQLWEPLIEPWEFVVKLSRRFSLEPVRAKSSEKVDPTPPPPPPPKAPSRPTSPPHSPRAHHSHASSTSSDLLDPPDLSTPERHRQRARSVGAHSAASDRGLKGRVRSRSQSHAMDRRAREEVTEAKLAEVEQAAEEKREAVVTSTSFGIFSKAPLQLSVTQSFLRTMLQLRDTYGAVKETRDRRAPAASPATVSHRGVLAPYYVKNCTGIGLSFWLGSSGEVVSIRPNDRTPVAVPGAVRPKRYDGRRPSRRMVSSDSPGAGGDGLAQAGDASISVQLQGPFATIRELPVNRDISCAARPGVDGESGPADLVICEVVSDRGARTLTVRSNVTVVNNTEEPLEVHAAIGGVDGAGDLPHDPDSDFVPPPLLPGQSISLPLEHARSAIIRFRPGGGVHKWSIGTIDCVALAQRKRLTRLFQCLPSNEDEHPSIVLNAGVEIDGEPMALDVHGGAGTLRRLLNRTAQPSHRTLSSSMSFSSFRRSRVSSSSRPDADEDDDLARMPDYKIVVRAPLHLMNLLPCAATFRLLDGKGGTLMSCELATGASRTLPLSATVMSTLSICTVIPGFDWSQPVLVSPLDDEIELELRDANLRPLKLRLSNIVDDRGIRRVSLFARYWLVNNTGLPLSFRHRSGNERLLAGQHLDDDPDLEPYLTKPYSYPALDSGAELREFFNETLFDAPPVLCDASGIRVRVAESSWSTPISLSTSNTTGSLHVQGSRPPPPSESPAPLFELGTTVHKPAGATFSCSTVIAFSPRYVLRNSASVIIRYRQAGAARGGVLLPGEVIPWHWTDASMPLRLCLTIFRTGVGADYNLCWSGAFAPTDLGPVPLRLLPVEGSGRSAVVSDSSSDQSNQRSLTIRRVLEHANKVGEAASAARLRRPHIVLAEARLTEATTVVTVHPTTGSPPLYRISNATAACVIAVRQDGPSSTGEPLADDILLPGEVIDWGWDNPCGEKKVRVTLDAIFDPAETKWHIVSDERRGARKRRRTVTLDVIRLCGSLDVTFPSHGERVKHHVRLTVIADGPTRVLVASDWVPAVSTRAARSVPRHRHRRSKGKGKRETPSVVVDRDPVGDISSSTSSDSSDSEGDSGLEDGVESDEDEGALEAEMEVRIELAEVGISLIDKTPMEIAYFSLSDLSLTLSTDSFAQRTEFKLGKLQIDNQSVGTPYPVFLTHDQQLDAPFVHCSIVRSAKESSVDYYHYAAFRVLECQVHAEIVFLIRMLVFVEEEILPALTSMEPGSYKLPDLFNSDVDDLMSGRWVYFELLHVHPIKVTLSYTGTVPNVSSGDKENLERRLGLLMRVGRNALSNIELATLELRALLLQHPFASKADMVGRISRHYESQLTEQVWSLLGAAEFLGSPISLVSNLGTGVWDLIYEPARGLVQSPAEFGRGVGRGVNSLVAKSVYGISNSVSKIFSSIGSGVALASFDGRYREERDTTRRVEVPHDAKEGVLLGLKDFGVGIMKGVSGIVVEPVRGAMDDGVRGIGKGLVRGVMGVAIKPAVGAFDLAARTTEGIRNSAISRAALIRKRPPRHFDLQLPYVRPYDWVESEGWLILKTLDDGEWGRERYVMHVWTEAGKWCLLGTRTKLFYLGVRTRGSLEQYVSKWDVDVAVLLPSPSVTVDALELHTQPTGRAHRVLRVKVDKERRADVFDQVRLFLDERTPLGAGALDPHHKSQRRRRTLLKSAME
jgi:hypothetical protein